MIRSVFLIAWAVICVTSLAARAEDYEYNGQKEVKNQIFTKLNCTIRVNGQSDVEGTYNRKGGTLDIWIDGQSGLEISGEAHEVIIRRINGQSTVSLRALKIGRGGVEIKDMNGQSKLYLADCGGTIDIVFIDGQCAVHYKQGTELAGQRNVRGESKLVPEK
jgi:hypothetical protein